MEDDIKVLADMYVFARRAYEEAEMEGKKRLAALKELMDAADKKLVEAMQDRELKSFTMEGIGRFQLDNQLFVNILKADRNEVASWLLGIPNGDAFVTLTLRATPDIQEVVRKEGLEENWNFNTTQLKSFVKELMRDGKEIHEKIGVAPVTRVKLTAA